MCVSVCVRAEDELHCVGRRTLLAEHRTGPEGQSQGQRSLTPSPSLPLSVVGGTERLGLSLSPSPSHPHPLRRVGRMGVEGREEGTLDLSPPPPLPPTLSLPLYLYLCLQPYSAVPYGIQMIPSL